MNRQQRRKSQRLLLRKLKLDTRFPKVVDIYLQVDLGRFCDITAKNRPFIEKFAGLSLEYTNGTFLL